MSEIKFDGFDVLHEFVALENFDRKVNELSFQRVESKVQFKKAVKTGDAPKKAVLTSKAPKRIRGLKFTPKKVGHHGRMIHFTNAKNSFKRSQKIKSRKGPK